MQSGHGLGKTWLSARLALWFLTVYEPSKVITTARSWEQVRTVLWSEIKAAYNQAILSFGGRLLDTELKVDDQWFMLGVSPKKEKEEAGYGLQRLQGLHSPNMLVIIDEAGLVDPDMLVAVNKLVVSPNNRILMVGNPVLPIGPFYEACRSSNWAKVHMSVFDHPNIVQDKVVIEGAVTRQWIEDQKKEPDTAEGTGLWKINVLGEFPDELIDALIPVRLLDAARELAEPSGPLIAGIDVAGEGQDLTVVTLRQGRVIREQIAFASNDPRGDVLQFLAPFRDQLEAVNVDSIGIGYNFALHLKDQGLPVKRINVARAASNSERFANKRAEYFMGLRKRFQDGDIKNLKEARTIEQLAGLTMTRNERGQTKIVSKQKLAKSPDFADSLMLAFIGEDFSKRIFEFKPVLGRGGLLGRTI